MCSPPCTISPSPCSSFFSFSVSSCFYLKLYRLTSFFLTFSPLASVTMPFLPLLSHPTPPFDFHLRQYYIPYASYLCPSQDLSSLLSPALPPLPRHVHRHLPLTLILLFHLYRIPSAYFSILLEFPSPPTLSSPFFCLRFLRP